MSAAEKLKHEVKAVLLAMAYFAIWIGTLMLIKDLILVEYDIAFHGFSMALVGALILSKVALILEHVPFGSWIKRQPAWVDVIVRTLLYALGVVVVMILEKGIEGRHEHGGFGGAVEAAYKGTDAPHVWANAICITGALLVWNAASVLQRHLGKGGFLTVFLSPVPDGPDAANH